MKRTGESKMALSTEEEAKQVKLLTYVIGGAVCFMFLMLTTCTMHMNSYNPEEAKAQAIITKAKIERDTAANTATLERLKVVKGLIRDQKVDPIAARCAVEGWTEKTSDVCLALVKPAEETEVKQ